MNQFKRILLIIDRKTLVVTILAVLSTYLCRRFEFTADFPLTLIGTAIIFPIVFSISGAYKRRESALREYGNIKAHGRVLYFASRDWLAKSDAATQEKMKELLGGLLRACRKLFSEPIDAMDKNERAVYDGFSEISSYIQSFRKKDLASGEVARCNQFLSKMIIAFENAKHIYQYRTPRTLKAYINGFIILLPILYGPYFAKISADFAPGLEYLLPVLFTVILVSLENIQEHLENPFDQVGEDDVVINAEKFVSRL
jgi:predicted membrane chloride channel (bestrophin family)